MRRKHSGSFRIVLNRINYFLTARYRGGHGIHSPVVFEFVTKVLFYKKRNSDYSKIEKLVRELKSDSTEIDFTELGGGSKVFKLGKRRISTIASKASISRKYGRLLYRIVKYYKPDIVVELGTSLGISAMYLALANDNSVVHTIEGNDSVIEKAKENSKRLGIENIRYHKGHFDNTLPELLNTIETPWLAYIDGNHTYEATIRYYQQLKTKMSTGILVFDDIYWSQDMIRAWKEIVSKETVTIDIFHFGIVILGEMLTPGSYKVRF